MRSITSFLLILITIAATARQITFDEAQAIASDFFNGDSIKTMKKASRRAVSATAETSADPQPYYVFNAADNAGFVIISGDTRAKKVLGYSYEGSFDVNNIPEGLNNLLTQYESGIHNIQANSANYVAQQLNNLPNKDNSFVLSTANWGQLYPFNLKMPKYTDDTPYFAGCVPVATGIIMRYHQWPPKGKGEASVLLDGQTLTVNLNESKYNWTKILDEYESNLPEEETNDVANLMRDIAFAVNASFTTTGTGSTSGDAADALVFNFYQPTISEISIDYSSVKDFFSVVKKRNRQQPPHVIRIRHYSRRRRCSCLCWRWICR